ncbi:MAG: ISAs1 family transposase [Beijerinckiaceae bacterium]|nr:ISAs1 family transposase [Beijerinckiaceae bacterium]
MPCGRWLTLLMNRIDSGLFSSAFTAWVRETWPGRQNLAAIDGKTSRRSHDRGAGKGPLHLVSAFAATSRLMLGHEAVEGKTNELATIPALIERLGDKGALKGAIVSIDAHPHQRRDRKGGQERRRGSLLAVKANQPTLRAETQAAFADADPKNLDRIVVHD